MAFDNTWQKRRPAATTAAAQATKDERSALGACAKSADDSTRYFVSAMKPYNTGTRMSYGTQPTLFDAKLIDGMSSSPARRTDQSTSHEAAADKQTTIATARERMLEIFRDGTYTANEAAMCCRGRFGELPHETYRKRKGELAKAGLIRCVGKRKCLVTGSTAEVWEVV